MTHFCPANNATFDARVAKMIYVTSGFTFNSGTIVLNYEETIHLTAVKT